MRTLYFSKKDEDVRSREMRQQFWRKVEEEQLKIAKKRVEQALNIEFSEGIGAGEYERSEGRKMYRSGHRYRDLQTWGGTLWRVKVPKGEKGYKFKLLKPWARHVEKFGEAVYRAFVYGMSDRKVAKFFEALYGKGILTPAGVSVIYQNLSREVEGWHRRSLGDDYRFVYLDGIWQSIRDTGKGSHRVVLAAMGVKQDGTVEIIDFRVEAGESASAWSRFLQSLYERGLVGQKLELLIHDGCEGLIDALRWVWPLTSKKYPKPLRLIGYFDAETSVTYEFLTNNFKLAALSIAKIYKARWQVELFFKWIKQHLKTSCQTHTQGSRASRPASGSRSRTGRMPAHPKRRIWPSAPDNATPCPIPAPSPPCGPSSNAASPASAWRAFAARTDDGGRSVASGIYRYMISAPGLEGSCDVVTVLR